MFIQLFSTLKLDWATGRAPNQKKISAPNSQKFTFGDCLNME